MVTMSKELMPKNHKEWLLPPKQILSVIIETTVKGIKIAQGIENVDIVIIGGFILGRLLRNVNNVDVRFSRLL